MAVLNNTIIFDGSTDNNFRSWTQNFNAHMTTGGFWIAAADTGQVDLTTVTHPAQSDTVFAGFKMFHTNDTLDNQFRLFMKVEYGTSARFGGSFTPEVRFTFSSSTDGAGTCIGVVSTAYQHFPGGNIATGSAGQSWSSGGTGYWSMLPWETVIDPTGTLVISVERALTSTGSYTSEYITWFLGVRNGNTGTNTISQRSIFKSQNGFSTELGNAHSLFINNTTATLGSFAAPFPVYPYKGFADNCMTSVMGLKTGDISEGGQFQTTLYGVSHNYLWSNRGPVAFGTATGMTNTGVGIRYE